MFLFKFWFPLPGDIPEAPADAGEDGAHADRYEAGDDDQLDPVYHVEWVHVD